MLKPSQPDASAARASRTMAVGSDSSPSGAMSIAQRMLVTSACVIRSSLSAGGARGVAAGSRCA